MLQGATVFCGLGDVLEGTPSGEESYEIGLRYRDMLDHGRTFEALGNHCEYQALRPFTLLGVKVAWDEILVEDLGDVVLMVSPYMRRGRPPYDQIPEGLSIAESMQTAPKILTERIAAVIASTTKPVLLAGHWTVEGATVGTGDLELHAGHEAIVPLAALDGVALTVLGHVHKAQDAAPNVLVAGAMYRTSFGEARYTPSYVLVTVDAGRVTWERRAIPCRAMFVETLDWPLTASMRASLTDTRSLDWLRGQEMKLTVRCPEDQLGTFDPSAFDAVKDVASLFVLERETVSMQRTRVPEIAMANSPDVQLAAWLRATEAEIDAATLERLTAKLSEATT